MSIIQRKLTKWVTRKVSGEAPFKKGRRDEQGNLVLKRARGVQVACFILFLLPMTSLILSIFTEDFSDVNEKIEFLVFMGMGALFLGIVYITLAISKTVITNDSVTTYRISGKKNIDFYSISSIEYTTYFGGCAVLKGDGVKLFIPLETCGFFEFYEILKSRFGEDKCKEIGDQLQNRKKFLEN